MRMILMNVKVKIPNQIIPKLAKKIPKTPKKLKLRMITLLI